MAIEKKTLTVSDLSAASVMAPEEFAAGEKARNEMNSKAHLELWVGGLGSAAAIAAAGPTFGESVPFLVPSIALFTMGGRDIHHVEGARLEAIEAIRKTKPADVRMAEDEKDLLPKLQELAGKIQESYHAAHPDQPALQTPDQVLAALRDKKVFEAVVVASKAEQKNLDDASDSKHFCHDHNPFICDGVPQAKAEERWVESQRRGETLDKFHDLETTRLGATKSQPFNATHVEGNELQSPSHPVVIKQVGNYQGKA